MSNLTVRTHYLEELATVTGLPTIREEAENFKPASTRDYPFVRYTFLPREGAQQNLGSVKVMGAGLVRIDLWYTRNATALQNALEVAEAIVAKFVPKTQQLTGVQLTTELCWYEATRFEPSAINVPVFVRWNSMAI